MYENSIMVLRHPGLLWQHQPLHPTSDGNCQWTWPWASWLETGKHASKMEGNTLVNPSCLSCPKQIERLHNKRNETPKLRKEKRSGNKHHEGPERV